MITAGIIIVLLGSTIRGWGALSHRRGPMEAAVIGSGSLLAIFSIFSVLLGIVGAVLIGMETSLWIGLIVFIAFWVLSGIWMPILAAIGL